MTQHDSPAFSIPSLLGRAGVSQQSKIFQLFALLVDAAGALQVPDLTRLEPGWERGYQPQIESGKEPLRHKCERLYRLSTGSQAIYRSSPQLAVNPLPAETFTNVDQGGALPAGGAVGGDGYFRVLVRASAARGPFAFFMDVDETIEIYAFSARMDLIGPPASTLITQVNQVGGTGTVASLQGNVIADVRIGASLEPIESGTGMREVRYTQFIPVALGASVVVPVPRYSRSVRIVQSTTGPISGAWLRQVGTATPLNVGQIAFDGRISRVQDAPIGRETSLVTDTNNLNARLFQVQWTIRP